MTERNQSFWTQMTPGDKIAGVIALVNVVLVGATICLVNTTKQLVTDATDTAEKQLRAYLVPNPPLFIKNAKNKGTNLTNYTVSFALENTGQTPAYDVRTRLAIAPREYPLAHDLPMEGTLAERAIVGKIAQYDGLQSDGFTDEQMREIGIGGNDQLYMRGHTCYTSLEKTRHVSFCFVYLGDKYRGFDACGKPWDYEDEQCPEGIFSPIKEPFEVTPEMSLTTSSNPFGDSDHNSV